MIYLNPDFKAAWSGKDPFEEAFGLEGEVFRSVKGRRTVRFSLNNKHYFAKLHHGVGWREIFKNLLQFKKPILSARNEYDAICRLKELDLATMQIAAFGERGLNPARRESFIITEELSNTISLEDFCRDWGTSPPPFALKRKLIEYLARVSRCLHRNGINHRDYYICHFLLFDPENWMNGIKVPLIDLHRAQLRRKTPSRWIIKDLSGLHFSSMDIGLTQRDRLRFLKIYSAKPLRKILREDSSFWKAVERKAQRLYAKEKRAPKG